MTEPSASPRFGWQGTLLLAIAAAALTGAAAFFLFSAFMAYDDEGYVLLSLKNFAEHGALYREVYSQYGPFPFVLYWVLHGLGMPITHMSGRIVTLLAWAGTAVACAAMVRRGTRSVMAALAVLTAVFAYLWVMANEPSHPGGIIAFTIAMAAALGHRWLAADRVARWAGLAGAVSAALVLTKINVGAFFVLSTLSWLLLYAQSDAIRRHAVAALCVGAALLPLALMRPLLDVTWVQTYALTFACPAVAVLLAAAPGRAGRIGTREVVAVVVGGLIMGGVMLGVVIARGTNLVELVNGVLLAPLKQPTSFSLPYDWPAGMRMVDLLSVLLCLTAWQLRRRGLAMVDAAVAGLRIAVVVGIAGAMLLFPAHSPDRIIFSFAMPCVWVLVWPLTGSNDRANAARVWLALLFMGQFLHAFPVAGSQIAWGTFLVLPLAALSGWDAMQWFFDQTGGTPSRLRPSLIVLLRCAAVAFALLLGVQLAAVARRYRVGSNLELPGAELVRVPAPTTAAFRLLTYNAAAFADMLFSEPGMASFNLWSGVPTPTRANVTHWFSLLDQRRQQGIIDALEQHPRACVIVYRRHVEYLQQRGFAPAGVLHDYIERHFRPAFAIDGFEFCVRDGRKIEPLMVGEIFLRKDLAESDADNTVLAVRLVLPAGRAIGRIELSPANTGDSTGRLVFHAGNSRVQIERLGSPETAMANPVGWPVRAEGAVMLRVLFNRATQPPPVAGSLITFRDAGDGEIALARLKE